MLAGKSKMKNHLPCAIMCGFKKNIFAVRALGTGTATKSLCNTPIGFLGSQMIVGERTVPHLPSLTNPVSAFSGMTLVVMRHGILSAKLTSLGLDK